MSGHWWAVPWHQLLLWRASRWPWRDGSLEIQRGNKSCGGCEETKHPANMGLVHSSFESTSQSHKSKGRASIPLVSLRQDKGSFYESY